MSLRFIREPVYLTSAPGCTESTSTKMCHTTSVLRPLALDSRSSGRSTYHRPTCDLERTGTQGVSILLSYSSPQEVPRGGEFGRQCVTRFVARPLTPQSTLRRSGVLVALTHCLSLTFPTLKIDLPLRWVSRRCRLSHGGDLTSLFPPSSHWS